jgi:DNA mismatch repair protein MutL
VGTTVEVAELFFNVPARRKFLKAQGTEAAHVSEAVLLAALARPDVTFVLVRDGRVVREHLRAQTRQDRVAQALGEDRLAVSRGERGPMAFEAHLAPPERARSGALALHIFVNGRPVKDRALARAVAQAYGSVLEPGKYPIGVVYIDIAPELVDVNVHPQKAEVRFADARAVQDALARELHKALATAFNLPSGGPLFRQITKPSAVAIEQTTWNERESVIPYSVEPDTVRSVAEEPQLFARGGFYSRLRYVGQVRATYLVCEGDDGLYVLDQHAAAERVTFHRLRKAFAAKEIATQKLLVPEVVQLLPAEVAVLEEAAEEAAQLGVELRAVGATGVAVHAVPKILARARPETVVRDLLAELGRAARRPFRDAADLVLATMACHGSVRAGDVLSKDEAEALLAALDEVDFAGHCPHGRPVVTRLGWEDLERRVGR